MTGLDPGVLFLKARTARRVLFVARPAYSGAVATSDVSLDLELNLQCAVFELSCQDLSLGIGHARIEILSANHAYFYTYCSGVTRQDGYEVRRAGVGIGRP